MMDHVPLFSALTAKFVLVMEGLGRILSDDDEGSSHFILSNDSIV
jgi:hypothetical protein